MFTGIVEELGTVTSVEEDGDGVRLTVEGPLVTSDAKHGDSIAVNGVCLTVVDSGAGRFTVDVVAETVRRSAIRHITAGDRVNLERAMALGDRLGGHIVQGHVDGTAVLLESDGDLTRFELPAGLSHYLVEKGSITVDGVSLTVVGAGRTEFSVALIPTTRELTTLGVRRPGEEVNIEVDVLAKHLERLAAAQLDRPRTGADGS
ncbi:MULTISPECIES: riboflavin synthase [Saccharopolyspora]|uniref:Riboflavin synthase n=1 Tax=Saccharopolyspora gregorii TaxID=33914 RepID=A0ABP6RQG4_9PSEU|nr:MULTISPECIES: riboflavin synthase [Saccharopolyspora]MCA1188804.1 riboflavin synthase [Saccharopolyspora sp. 6T]MCA1195786.1 riboflavin synthase [Saccharopolyspora sp. 6V]MCA1226562.1 riboflavin synthase [Saccharopolyspora sp. 6M]MCA1283170.1 riboflavin synthase [Saccharopolyspora sp. 7B]